MRKILTTSMVVGAALLVAACGGGDKAANNTADMNATNDVVMDDMNTMDSGNAMGGDANAMNDMNSATTADNTVAENAAQ
ncbi:MAG TPA: hypothetical protein VLK25_04435 [Allosphingosinicella sp.]|nr:hypothetical protein [Allosphingosinicella sp.]